MADQVWLGSAARALIERFGSPERGIVELARRVLEEAKIKGPPFYPDLLAPVCNVKRIRTRRIPRAGMLVRETGGYVIYVSRKFAIRSPQWNAVCAHEIGHVLLGQVSERALDRENSWVDEDEYLADRAERELLLPSKEFREAAHTSRLAIGDLGLTVAGDSFGSPKLLAQLSELFRAPIRTTAQRLVETGIWQDLILVWGTVNDELVLRQWWPQHHPASRLFQKTRRACEIFESADSLWQVLSKEGEIARLESVGPKRNLFWFVRSGRFAEHGNVRIVSFVITPGSNNVASPPP